MEDGADVAKGFCIVLMATTLILLGAVARDFFVTSEIEFYKERQEAIQECEKDLARSSHCDVDIVAYVVEEED